MSRFLTLALILLSLSSCRFGNYQQNAPGLEIADGYYEMVPSATVQICATRPVLQQDGSTQIQTNCHVEPVSHLDQNLQFLLPNPTNLKYDTSTGFFQLGADADLVNTIHIPVFPFAPNGFGWNGPTVVGIRPMRGTHSGCELDSYADINGTYSAGGFSNSGASVPIVGRIAMTMTWGYASNGNADCGFLTACYNDPAQCNATDQQMVHQFFSDLIGIGILTAADLSNTSKIEYQVSYH